MVKEQLSSGDMIKRFEVERRERWREFLLEIPWISFPSSWSVKMIPPFGGATVRFMIRLPCEHVVSVYLDCFDTLGVYCSPYWEVYPVRGDSRRCDMQDVSGLISIIASAEEQSASSSDPVV